MEAPAMHQWPAGIRPSDVHAPVGISARRNNLFDLWDFIGLGEVEKALDLLKKEPALACLEALCLNQTAATKAFAGGEHEIIEHLLSMPKAYFGFDPGMKSPLMILLYDEDLLDFIGPVLQKGFFMAWPCKEILEALGANEQRMLVKGLTVVRKNIEEIERRELLNAEQMAQLKAVFEYERSRIYNAILPN